MQEARGKMRKKNGKAEREERGKGQGMVSGKRQGAGGKGWWCFARGPGGSSDGRSRRRAWIRSRRSCRPGRTRRCAPTRAAGFCAWMITGHAFAIRPLRLDPAARVELSRADMARALGQALARAGLAEARVRLTLGVPEGELFISLERLDPLPAELYERGVAVAVCPFVPHATRAKSTASITPLRGAKAGLPAWAHEGVMVDQAGLILEGLSSNFLAVKDGRLRTAGENVIAGTTRTLVLELAAGLVPVVLEPVGVSELGAVAECFITSVSREVLPVVRVGETVIGDGRPGAVTRELLRRFRGYVRTHAQVV